jgi:hypothetical protein
VLYVDPALHKGATATAAAFRQPVRDVLLERQAETHLLQPFERQRIELARLVLENSHASFVMRNSTERLMKSHFARRAVVSINAIVELRCLARR